MQEENYLIGILGLGMTGVEAVKYLIKHNVKIICYEDNKTKQLEFSKIFGDSYIKEINDPVWKKISKLLVSPGINPNHQLMQIIKNNNIEIISDIELFFTDLKTKIVAITGTNGKSTTTALTHFITEKANKNFGIGGNIGLPILALPSDKEGYILELSSYQLDLLKNIEIFIAVILNITPDHLDRYGTMDNYIAAKEKILSFLSQDSFAIINIDNETTNQIYNKLANNSEKEYRVIPVSIKKQIEGGVYLVNNEIHDNINEDIISEVPFNKFLKGEHNLENILTSYAIARVLGISNDTILQAIASFKGLAHRMQYVGKINHMNFYNDSKATNADAASKSLEVLDNIYWIAGGVAKAEGITPLIPFFNKIKKAFFYGQDKHKFAETASSKLKFQIVDNLAEAVQQAYSEASNNQEVGELNILLAPAAASQDQFSNFEERGNKFIELCTSLNNCLSEK